MKGVMCSVRGVGCKVGGLELGTCRFVLTRVHGWVPLDVCL